MSGINNLIENKLKTVRQDARFRPVIDQVKAANHQGVTSDELLTVAVKATVDEDKMSLAYWRARGEEPPLFVLNYHASKGDAAIRDEARDLARAVGQVAYEQALDRDHRNRHSRERKMNRAVSEQARIKAAQTDDKA